MFKDNQNSGNRKEVNVFLLIEHSFYTHTRDSSHDFTFHFIFDICHGTLPTSDKK